MKRLDNLFEKIVTVENLQLADSLARRRKHSQYGVIAHDKKRESNIELLHLMLITKAYKTSSYTTFPVFEPKERLVYKLPYYPDRITHHAVMNILEPVFVSVFTKDTYSCIKGRGIHGAAKAVRKSLDENTKGTKYCLKLDIKKFYPNIDHDILKALLRRKFKDQDLIWLLDEIIDSAEGLPIGNYLSQYFANFYLTYFDHWLKETKRVKYYFRYADDIVILSDNKVNLHELLYDIKTYLHVNLKLSVKGNYQVFPVAKRGIDFVGYKFFPGHTLLRKLIKQNYARMVALKPNQASIASYKGWTDHCDAKHLNKKLLKQAS